MVRIRQGKKEQESDKIPFNDGYCSTLGFTQSRKVTKGSRIVEYPLSFYCKLGFKCRIFLVNLKDIICCNVEI